MKKTLCSLLLALLAAPLLTSCATNGAYSVDPEPQRNANQHLQDSQQRRALSAMSDL